MMSEKSAMWRKCARREKPLPPAAFAAGKHQNCLCIPLKSVVFLSPSVRYIIRAPTSKWMRRSFIPQRSFEVFPLKLFPSVLIKRFTMNKIILFSHFIPDHCLCVRGPICATFSVQCRQTSDQSRAADIQARLSLVPKADSDHLICPL